MNAPTKLALILSSPKPPIALLPTMALVDNNGGIADSGDQSDKKSVQIEHAPDVPVVSEETEKRLLKKLDRRIIPICCWIYLMNFMDRG